MHVYISDFYIYIYIYIYIYLILGLHDISHAISNAHLVSEQRLGVVNAAHCEITHVMEITADYRTGFTDKMRIRYHMRDIVQPY